VRSSDSFTYQTNDGKLNSNTITVTITVSPANDAPIAVADQITVVEAGTATTLVGGAISVLANDTDAENNPLGAVLVSGVSNGTLTLNSNGTFTYVHNGSETTSDSFTYQANDGYRNSNVVIVSISITKNLSTDSYEKTIEVVAHPNPTRDIVEIAIPEELVLEKIELYNSSGELVGRYSTNVIPFQSFAAGNYFLRIFTSKGSISKKIIKI